MMRTINFDHHSAKESFKSGNKLATISQKTKKEKEKQ